MSEEHKSCLEKVKSNCTDAEKVLGVLGGFLGYVIPSIIYYSLSPENPDDKIPGFIGVCTAVVGIKLGRELGKWLKGPAPADLGDVLLPHYPEDGEPGQQPAPALI
jgi:hypothetical protein